MAKKFIPPTVAKSDTNAPKVTTAPAAVAAVSTPVRNTAVPPKSMTVAAAPARKAPPTYDAIAIRAYTIWKSSGGNELENWVRAERELSSL